MKIILIIQARMGSTRLPGKILRPLGSTVVLDYDVTRCRQIDHVQEVIVATSALEQDQAIVDWCREHGVTCFRGSEDDVLARYYECAKPYDPDYVIRVTSDCPFIDYHLGSKVVQTMLDNPADIVLLDGQLPRGLAIEMVSFQALEYMYVHGHENRHREHVTYYAYEFPEPFKAVHCQVPESMRHPELRITLDTPEDYELLQTIADHFQDKLVPSQEVVRYLLANPEVAAINAHIQQKPVV
ncbi:glycosyltransferase family protein [Paenibacillus hamazuiensis]|uniref:glycosyltransferase family protein n=1 Tax=Paenibacillus hamazuiensis TaxID=2936508 RepID=UPI00200BF9F2|nr:glycosyltransferase family protein [Paenibacillus hamazuiensis]